MDVMSVASLATSMKQAETSQAIGIAVAGKVMDAQRQQGAAALQMLQAAQIGPGDALAAQATGRGGMIDTYA
jgi:hypothetical protein